MTIYRNHQWEVTEYGLSSTRPGAPYEYHIEASRLLESGGAGNRKLYDWPSQLGEKTWVDIEAFVDAYRQAITAHRGRYNGTVDPAILEASIEAGRTRNKGL